MRIENQVAKALTTKRKTLSLAESCTGGLIADTLTNISGSSAFLHLGIVVYDNAAKTKLLNVSPKILATHGAVSEQTAKLMAQNVRKILKTDLGVGVTGIAGPTGGSKDKPVGLVYISVATTKTIVCEKFLFNGNRISIKQKSAKAALRLILNTL